MRQFILAANAAYPTALTALTAGQVAFTYLDNGVETLVKNEATAAKVTGRGNIIWKNKDTALGNILYPFFKKNFTYSKGVYVAATTFSANFTVGTVAAYKDYTVILVKKGKKFNERNKWISTIHTGANPTAANVAAAIAKHINANTTGNGVTAAVATAKVTITASKAGEDYEVVLADELYGTTVTTTAHGIPAYGDAAYVKDLAMKAAADAGFEYTYDDFDGLYPAYPLNPLASADATDTGFTIYTLRFAEPRETKTVDEVVHQIIQIAYPTGSAAITTVDKILNILAGGTASTAS